MILFSPLTKSKWARFRSIRRGYVSFVILSLMIGGSLFAELFVNNRAILVKYQDQFFFPTYGKIIPGKTFGLDYGAFAFPHGDGGITRDFFGELRKAKAIDISFGGGGIIEDSVEFHFQRFSLEAPIASAKKLVSFQIARRGYRRLRGIRRIER